MAVVARVLPRDWDAGRLLRFLAGLAMLALAFAAPALPAPATPATVTTVTAAQADETPVTVSEPAPAPLGVRGEPALPVSAGVLAVLTAVVVLPLAGRVGRVRGERAPPAV
jgi:hypothetical protein